MENNTISNVTTPASSEEVEKLHKSFYPATLIYGSLPYRPIESNLWVRENGRNRTAITAGAITNPDGTVESFVPSGKLARAALLYLTTEAKKTGSPRIDLSKSYRGFLKDLGLPWNSRNAREAEKQLRAVLSMTINVSITEHRENGDTKITEYDLMVGRGREIVFDANADIKERESYLLLSDDFFESVIQSNAVPVETETWRELLSESKSPLALDIYLWLSSRLPKLQAPLYINWEQLQAQFGSQAQEIHDFKRRFRVALQEAQAHLPNANVTEEGQGQGKQNGFKGLVLRPSKRSITQK